MTSISDQEQDVTRADGMRQTEQDILGQVGSTIDERYEIVSLLGKGGMSVVYKAKDLFLDRIVAVKMLLKGSVASHEALQRFQYEAKAISQLKHANIIQVYAFNASELGVYLVMDYLEGISLDEILREDKRVPVDRALPIFRQTAAALEHAHSQGIVHRDLKPSNIMLVHEFESAEDDVVKLVDFGIAKLMPHEGEQVQQLTRAGAVFGTPAYMSPEQCTGRPLDARSDIYSFGSVMFEIIVGDPPLEGETPLATMYLQLQEKPPLLSEAMPGQEVSLDLERIIAKCLEKDPDNRFQTMNEVVGALASINRNSTTVVRISQQRPARKKRPNKTRNVILFALVVLVLTAASAVWIYREQLQALYYDRILQDVNSTTEQRKEAHRKMADLLDRQNRSGEVVPHLFALADLAERQPGAKEHPRECFERWCDIAEYVDCHKIPGDEQFFFGSALSWGEQVAQQNPSDDDVNRRLRNAVISLSRTTKMPGVYDRIFAFAALYDQNGQFQKAKEWIDLIQDIPEGEIPALTFLTRKGSIAIHLGDFATAQRCFDEAIAKASSPAAIAANAANLFAAGQKWDLALTYYDRGDLLAKRDKDYEKDMGILRDKCECLLRQHKPQQADEACRAAKEAWDKSGLPETYYLYPTLLHAVGDTQFELKNYQQAARAFGKEFGVLLKFTSKSDMERHAIGIQRLAALRALGQSLYAQQSWSEAAVVYKNALYFAHTSHVVDSEINNDANKQMFAEQHAKNKVTHWSDILRRYIYQNGEP